MASMHVQTGTHRPMGGEAAIVGEVGEEVLRPSSLPTLETTREFETQHKLLILETLYDAGRSLGALPDESALVEDVLHRAVGVLDAARGYLATFGEGGERRSEARVGFPRRLPDPVVAEDGFLTEVARSEGPVRQTETRLLRTAVWSVHGEWTMKTVRSSRMPLNRRSSVREEAADCSTSTTTRRK